MALAVDENPPELLLPLGDPSLQGREWCAVRTKSRQEKKLAWHLVSLRVPYFLPMRLNRTVSRNSTLKPLFDSLLFIAFDKLSYDLENAKDSRSVVQFIYTKLQARLKAELALIASESYRSRTLRAEPGSFRTGDAVRVREGPMLGLEGRVYNVPDEPGARIVVDLLFMGRHSMQINPKFLEAI